MTTTRRNSRQRTLVYQVVKDSHSHPNAEEVYLLVRPAAPGHQLGHRLPQFKFAGGNGFVAQDLHRHGRRSIRCCGNSAPASDLLLLWGSV